MGKPKMTPFGELSKLVRSTKRRIVDYATNYMIRLRLISSPRVGRKAPILIFHYIYIISLTLISSLCLYIRGGIAYIDALFLGSAACTQSGLTTIDVITLSSWQQAVLYIFVLISNTAFIHSAIAIIRVGLIRKQKWNIVQEAKRQIQLRKTQTIKRREEELRSRNVGKRDIQVLLNQGNKFKTKLPPSQNDVPVNNDVLRRSSSTIHMTAEDAADADLTAKAIVSAHLKGTKLKEQPQRSIDVGGSEPPSDPEPLLAEDGEISPRDSTEHNLPTSQRISVVEENAIVNDDNESSEEFQINSTKPARSRAISFDYHIPLRSNRRKSNSSQIRSGVGFLKAMTVDRIMQGGGRLRKSISRSSYRSDQSIPYLSYQPVILRNSKFVDLTTSQKEELQGIEYRALTILCFILIAYYVCFILAAFFCFFAFIKTSSSAASSIKPLALNSGWWAAFTSNSVFLNFGLTLNPNSFIDYQKKPFILVISCLFIAAGNTAFPVFLRLIIWILFAITPNDSPRKDSYAFLLDHPRRCFTLLFPKRPTLVLLGILLLLSAIDVFLFYVLDRNNPTVSSIPSGPRFCAALFQAFSNRTAGFNVVNLADLQVAVQISYMVMMYISVFPIAISLRRTNVLEQESLGIVTNNTPGIGKRLIKSHVRRQLSFDIWFITLAVFLISIIENTSLQDQEGEPNFDVWRILFEVISAYGTVGLSLGYPGINSSFSTKLKVLSKLIIIACAIRGRHRGLPYNVDLALQTPGKDPHTTSNEPLLPNLDIDEVSL